MNNVLHIGATGLRTQQSALDVLANNVANINTPAFKRNTVAFSELVGKTSAVAAGAEAPAAGADAGLGVQLVASPKVLEQGELRKTDNALDIAIRGAGFIELQGPAGQTLLWRGGSLRVNSDGFLAAANGLQLKTAIAVPQEASGLVIGEDGRVAAVMGGKTTQQIGQIELVQVSDARALGAVGEGLYRIEDPVADIKHGQPGEAGMGLLAQGFMEGSNVKMAEEMVNMMLMQRAYAANARLIQVADDLMNTVNQLRR